MARGVMPINMCGFADMHAPVALSCCFKEDFERRRTLLATGALLATTTLAGETGVLRPLKCEAVVAIPVGLTGGLSASVKSTHLGVLVLTNTDTPPPSFNPAILGVPAAGDDASVWSNTSNKEEGDVISKTAGRCALPSSAHNSPSSAGAGAGVCGLDQ